MCQLREGKIEGRKGEEGEGRKEEEGALSPPIPISLTPWPHRDAAAVAGRGRRALTFVGAEAAGSASVTIGGVASSAISSDSASVTPALSAASTTPPPLPEAGVSVVLLPTMAASSSPVQPPKHPPLPVRRLPARQQTYRPRPLRALQPTGRAPPRQAVHPRARPRQPERASERARDETHGTRWSRASPCPARPLPPQPSWPSEPPALLSPRPSHLPSSGRALPGYPPRPATVWLLTMRQERGRGAWRRRARRTKG